MTPVGWLPGVLAVLSVLLGGGLFTALVALRRVKPQMRLDDASAAAARANAEESKASAEATLTDVAERVSSNAFDRLMEVSKFATEQLSTCHDRVEVLEAEVQALHKEIAVLRREVSALRKGRTTPVKSPGVRRAR